MFNIASNLSPTQSTTLPWPQRFTAAVKTLWGAAQPVAAPATIAETVATDKPVLLTLRASLPGGRSDVVCLAVEGELSCHTYTSLIETGPVALPTRSALFGA